MKNYISILQLAALISTTSFVYADEISTFQMEPNFSINCSPIKQAGCNGILPLRDSENSQVADLASEKESLAYRLQTLKSAQKSIRIQALIFTGDETGLRVSEILKQKAKQGLDVRVVVDGLSNPSPNSQMMYYDLIRNGVQLEGYEPALLQWMNEVNPGDPKALNKRFHEKMWVIDAGTPSQTAVLGGLNIANEYFQIGKIAKEIWRDQDVAVKGEIVSDLKTAFDRNWHYFKTMKESKPGIFNPDSMRKFLFRFSNQSKYQFHDPEVSEIESVEATGPLGNPYGKDFLDEDKIKMVLAAEEMKVDLKFSASPMRFMQSRPRFKENFIMQQYLHEIKTAQSEIVIVNAYFVPSPELQEAIREATSVRHVKVHIITNSPETNDLPIMAYVARSFYENMFGKTIEEKKANSFLRIYEWQGNQFNMGTLHAKYAVFDKKRVLVGSFNLDPRSENLNSESILITDNQMLAANFLNRLIKIDLSKTVAVNLERAIGFNTTDQKTMSQSKLGMIGLQSY